MFKIIHQVFTGKYVILLKTNCVKYMTEMSHAKKVLSLNINHQKMVVLVRPIEILKR